MLPSGRVMDGPVRQWAPPSVPSVFRGGLKLTVLFQTEFPGGPAVAAAAAAIFKFRLIYKMH